VRVVAVVALLALAAGCSESDESSEGSRPDTRAIRVAAPPTTLLPVPTRPFPGAGENCPTSEPSPITIMEAIRALRANGFSVSEVERSCGLNLISGMLTNLGVLDAMAREGSVSCFVLATRDREVPVVVGGDTAAAHAERRLANLKCDVYGADAVGFKDDEVKRLDLAFKALETAVHR
jgi:hypothetical protein